MKTTRMFVLSLLALNLWGCGPEQTMDTKIDEEKRERVAQKANTLEPLAGKYVGTIELPTGKKVEAILVLELVTVMVSDTQNNSWAEVPSLAGSLYLCPSSQICLGRENESELFDLPVNQFTAAVYDVQAKRLSLSSTPNPVGTSSLFVQSFIRAFADGNVIEGQYGTTLRPRAGVLKLRRER